MSKADLSFVFGAEPEDAVKYLEDKGYKISWDWHDTLNEAHAKAFTVAKMTEMDLLQDTHNMMTQALKEGWSGRDFELKASEMFKKRGWWGRQELLNPKTGKLERVQLGSPYRVRTVFNTNMQSSYMAGRWRQAWQNRDKMPYGEYLCVMNDRSRPSHKALHGTIAPLESTFWQVNMPPNGYNCKCRMRAVDEDYAKDKKVIAGDKFVRVADAGFESNPGVAAFYPDLDKYDYKIAKDFCTGIVTGKPFELFYNKAGKNAQYALSQVPQALKTVEKNSVAVKYIYDYLPSGAKKEYQCVAVLDELKRAQLGTKSQAVRFSAENFAKNIINHPDLTLDDYKLLPSIVDKTDVLIYTNKASTERIICFSQNKKYYKVVIKTIKTKSENYLQSFHKTDLKRIKDELKKDGAKVVIDKLTK